MSAGKLQTAADGQGWWRAIPLWGKIATIVAAGVWCVVCGVVVLVILGMLVGDDGAKQGVTTTESPKPAELDQTTLFNSVAQVFVARHSRVYPGEPQSRLSHESRIACDKRSPRAYSCELPVHVPIVSDVSWTYDVTTTPDDCWTARTRERYGPMQGSVDSYQNRGILAPSTDRVRSIIRQANALRDLSGCASNVSRPLVGDPPERFVAALAAQNVQRERPGGQRSTVCRYLGKQEIDFAPDHWGYTCRTTMVSGAVFIDELSCYDPPPYATLDSCTEQAGYPKRPPRELPVP